MPNPTMVHPQSSKLQHFLGLVDLYIDLKQPSIYEVEPTINDEYRPDVYMRVDEPVIVEYQRSLVSNKVMQKKIDMFVEAHKKRQHDAKTLWIVTDRNYSIRMPDGYKLIQSGMKK